MARKKITQLTAFTSTPASTDVLPLVDLAAGAAGVTKKATALQLLDAGLSAAAWTNMPYASCAFTANGGGTWTVDAGDFIYYKWIKLNAKAATS